MMKKQVYSQTFIQLEPTGLQIELDFQDYEFRQFSNARLHNNGERLTIVGRPESGNFAAMRDGLG